MIHSFTHLLTSQNLPTIFSKKTLAEVNNINPSINPSNYINLTSLPFCTIDDESAKDFDDAIYCTQKDNFYILYVAIADVASYVKPKSNLDLEAAMRTTSIYLPGTVIPMLPDKLSNDLCSLIAHQPRSTLCCKIKINNAGTIHSYSFIRALIVSKARLTYIRTQEIIQKKRSTHSLLHQSIKTAAKLTKKLLIQKESRRALSIESPEIKAIQNTSGDWRITDKPRLFSQLMIEEAMICANRCAAHFMINNKVTTLHRSHLGVNQDRFFSIAKDLKAICKKDMSPNDPSSIGRVLQEIQQKDHALARSIFPTLLSTLIRAEYSTDEDTGHFGLGLNKYLHFTSPIRRYADLLVHRQIHALLDGQTPNYLYLEKLAKHINETCAKAEKVERKTISIIALTNAKQYLHSKIFTAYATNITHFGTFCHIPELYIDILIRFDRKKQRKSEALSLGDKITVKLTNVDTQKIQAKGQLV